MVDHPVFPLMRPDMGQLGFNSFTWINSRSSAPHPSIPRQKYSLTKVWRGEIFATCCARGFSEGIGNQPWATECNQGHHMALGPPHGARLG